MYYARYIAIATAILFALSAVQMVNATSGAVLAPSQVQLNGPRVDAVIFSVISSDSTLYNSLTSGAIQGAEWTFTTGTFASAETNPNLYANSTVGYTFDGVAFNMLQPVINTTAYRRAMEYLTDYGFIQSTVLSGVAGSAQPDLYPCVNYPAICNPAIETFGYNLNKAVGELKLAGLSEGNTSDVALSSITWLYKGAAFSPKFYYRSDDPLRTGVAQQLIQAAAKIGLIFNAIGISGSAAGGDVYGPSGGAVISPGVYNPATGYNSPPVYNFSAATTSDTWGMYTFGWITSSAFDWAWYFFNSQGVGVDNFLNYYNRTMDYYTNQEYYGSTISSVETAAKQVDIVASQQLPYLMSFYQNTLFAMYINGWAGYADIATTGPTTSLGIYYTLLDVHPAGAASGGVFNYGIHQVPDAGGLNPLYNTEWIWQADIWGEVYDSPLATIPTEPSVALAYENYMTQNYSVAPFSGSTGTSSGWFQMQGTQQSQKIVGGNVVTFNFDKNITWTDHVPLTAADYNYSLWAWGVSLPPSLPDVDTPAAGSGSGPAGLIATYIPPSDPYEIQMFFNSSSVWNLATALVPVLPQHVFQYFNQDKLATASGAMDTTQPFVTATSASACGTPCSYLPPNAKIPTWLQYLPNLEVGSGPFWLKAYSGTTGAGELDKNVNYFRSAWAATAPTVSQGASYTLTSNIQEWIYNAGTSAMAGVQPGQVGPVPILNATGTVTVYSPSGAKVTSATLSGGSDGAYTTSFSTAGWGAGTYELVAQASYNFLGLARTWYQATGLNVTVPTTTTATVTSTSVGTVTSTAVSTSVGTVTSTAVSTSVGTVTSTATTTAVSVTSSSAPNYTPYYLGVIVVLIIVVIAVALLSRRTPKPTT